MTLRRLVLLGTPLVLTALLFFHPSPYDDVAGELIPIVGWWIALHTIGFADKAGAITGTFVNMMSGMFPS